jgi:hypothetical protein
MDAGRHLAVLGQPVHGVVGDDMHPDAAPHAAMGVVAGSRPGLRPRYREGMNAPPLGGKGVLEHCSVPPVSSRKM